MEIGGCDYDENDSFLSMDDGESTIVSEVTECSIDADYDYGPYTHRKRIFKSSSSSSSRNHVFSFLGLWALCYIILHWHIILPAIQVVDKFWPECLSQAMNPIQCKNFLEEEICKFMQSNNWCMNRVSNYYTFSHKDMCVSSTLCLQSIWYTKTEQTLKYAAYTHHVTKLRHCWTSTLYYYHMVAHKRDEPFYRAK